MNETNETGKIRTKMITPRYRLEVRPDISTIACDFIKCAVDHDTNTVTLIFF